MFHRGTRVKRQRRSPPSPSIHIGTIVCRSMSSWLWSCSLILTLGGVLSSSAEHRPPVPDDCQSSPFEDEGLALICSLSAINSAEEKTNFSVIPFEHTLSLTVRCREPSLSHLEADGFRSLLHLRKLTLDGCHLRSIPPRAFQGLDKLRSLTVKTRNAGVLSVATDAFVGLGALEHLDLSGNYIRYLSSHALCPLPKLMSLNLSHNEIGTLADLGSSLTCLEAVQRIDLSHNDLAHLSSEYVTPDTWPQLEELRLDHNYIRSLKGNILRMKTRLHFIDLSNNQLSTLPEHLFQDASRLKRISLSNNSLVALPPKLFEGPVSQSLEVLDLSGNLLTSVEAPLLDNLEMLTFLDLSFNALVSIESARDLRGLGALQSLKLSHNKLSRLPNLPLPSLRSLVLSHNELGSKLPGRVFSKLPSLSHLLLDFNAIEELPESLFVNSSRITVLDLSHNRLATMPPAINSLKSLQSFAISHNHLKNLSRLQLPGLWRLQASGNRLGNVTALQLVGLPALQVLDLSQNRIKDIEKSAFDGNQPLQALRLDDNKLTRVEGLFRNLPNLTWLNVSANEISVFDYAMVPTTLQWLDIHQNQLRSLENYFSLEAQAQLTHLDASFNQIQQIGPQNVPNGVETLLLNDNEIAVLVPYTFFKKGQLKKVDLSVNRLEMVDRNSLRLSSEQTTEAGVTPFMPRDTRPKFYLGGNPIRCDCHMAWFKSINNADVNALQNFPHVADLESIYCQLLYSREKSFVPLVEAKTEEFLCSYKTHCFALCHCCDYDACDCEMTCPSNCTCYHDTTWTKNIAECSNAEFRDLPEQLPMDATEIFLDGNNLEQLHSHTFIGRKNLKVLYLNNSLISIVDNHTFNGLASLEVLHLEDNAISQLQGDEFHGLLFLRELHVENNRIRAVNNATFRDLRSLEVLFLHGNHIMDFPAWTLALNPQLRSVQLAGNHWSCSCRFMENFRLWLIRSQEVVHDSHQIMCVSANEAGTDVLTSSMMNITNCLQDSAITATTHIQQIANGQAVDERGFPEANGGVMVSRLLSDFLPIFFSIVAVVVALVIVALLVFLYRNEARLWLYSKYGIRFFHRIDGIMDDADKIFDAFLAYSAKDEVFVRQVLAPELEISHTSQQYKLCLFYRDLPSIHHHLHGGATNHNIYHQIPDSIVQAAEASRRTVIILSEHFLKSEWARYDYKSGLHTALRCNRGQKLIVILLGDIASRRDLDPELRLYMKSGIVLQWGDKLFWDKLRYALPDTRVLNSSAFSPDTNSFRYETYNPHHSMATRSMGSSTYQSVLTTTTPDEQDSTRTMTIHI
eukprot:snap_masked-scaffold28_size608977-processed-gene-5.4 protein:Tk05757 transcript:snap_masked-scaffold28_size608977-processed-gene-5.4-mRNA-1 annotation:"slit homolog 2 protein"